MKIFKFRLDSVLFLREREEQAAVLEYTRALEAMAQAHHALSDSRNLRDRMSAAFAERRKHGFRAAEQDIFWNAMRQRHEECKQRGELFEKTVKDAEKRRAAMFTARRKREMVLLLKSKQLQAHQTGERHAEELQIDDIVSSRYAAHLERTGT
jgi:flagellar export protein FliJ